MSPGRELAARVKAERQAGRVILVIGIGNDMLGDDGVGCLVARDLAGLEDQGLIAVDASTAIENAAHLVRRHRPGLVLLVDSAIGLEEGKDWAFVPPARLDTFCHSTHAVPLPLLVTAWKSDVPDLNVRFIGVTPANVALGAEMSPGVNAARRAIGDTIRNSLSDCRA